MCQSERLIRVKGIVKRLDGKTKPQTYKILHELRVQIAFQLADEWNKIRADGIINMEAK